MKHRIFCERRQFGWKIRQYLFNFWDAITYAPFELLDRYYYEKPSFGHRDFLIKKWSSKYPSIRHDASSLINDGVVILNGYFDRDQLAEMQTDFQTWCDQKGSCDANGFLDFDGAKIEGYLSSSISMSRAFTDEYLTLLVEMYWGKSIQLAYAHGYRLEPIPPKEYRAFRWHHDLKRKQVKVMLLLTDTPSDGQRLEYLKGSHKIWHRFTRHRHAGFEDVDVVYYGGERLDCSGLAGTVIIFDTNGIHRGHRNMGPRRDQYTCNYTGGKALFNVPEIHPEIMSQLNDRMRKIFRAT